MFAEIPPESVSNDKTENNLPRPKVKPRKNVNLLEHNIIVMDGDGAGRIGQRKGMEGIRGGSHNYL